MQGLAASQRAKHPSIREYTLHDTQIPFLTKDDSWVSWRNLWFTVYLEGHGDLVSRFIMGIIGVTLYIYIYMGYRGYLPTY